MKSTSQFPAWQPISEAPDDRQIWVAYKHKARWVYRVAHWKFGAWCAVPGELRIDPTHFSIPEAPE